MRTENPAAGRLIGYARCSTDKQDLRSQITKLVEFGVQERDIYSDEGVSGARTSRPGLDLLLDPVRGVQPGDTLVVFKLDRIGRSTGHVIGLLDELFERGVHVRSIVDGIDTTTPAGRTMLELLAVFARMERSFIQERTRAGLDAARQQGRTGGRPRRLDVDQAKAAQAWYDERKPVAWIAKTLGTSPATIYRALERKAPDR